MQRTKTSSSTSLSFKIFVGMVIGVILGLLSVNFHFEQIIKDWIVPWGTIFLRLLKFVAVPLVIASLIKGICGLKNVERLSRLGFKTLGIYIVTTVCAIIIGISAVLLIKPGNYISDEKSAEFIQQYEQPAATEASVSGNSVGPLQFIVDIVPENIISAASNNSKMLQIIFIAIIFGIAIIIIGEEKTKTFTKLIDDLNVIILKIIDFIMVFAPIGVLALMAGLTVNYSGEADVFKALGMYAATVIIALLFISFVFYPILIKLFSKKKIGNFIKAMLPVQLLAFSTSSSAATLPLTIESAEKNLGISNETASFVLPVGVTINMDGTSCYQAVAAIFMAQVLGLDLSFTQILIIIATTTISSIGTPGIPGGSIVMLMIVLNSVGIPPEGLALIMGVDRPLDMLRTVVNVTGDTTVACMMDNSKREMCDA
jgi:proton glutamate symport protein